MAVNVQKIIDVLEAEAGLISGNFIDSKQRVCGHAGRCAIGALIVAAGVSPNRLSYIEHQTHIPVKEAFARELLDEYGLRPVDTSYIIHENDSVSSYDPETGNYLWGIKQARRRCQAVISYIRNRSF